MKIGIIGCGGIARTHAKTLQKNVGDCTLVFCDRNESRADDLANTFSGRAVYNNAEALLQQERPDAVHILTQLASHNALIRSALQAGAHVYVEKPVTETPGEFRELLSLAETSGKLLCAGYSTLGIPVVQKAKRLIKSGKFGRLVTVHCDFNWTASGNSIPYGSPDHWAYSLPGGILQNIIDHPMSVVVDFMENVTSHNMLFCRRNELPNQCPDIIHVGLRNSDQIGSLTVSFGHGNTHAQAQFCLEAGTIIVDLRRQLIGYAAGSGAENLYRKTVSGVKLGWALGRGSLGNVAKRMSGSLQRDPGITGLVNNFYSAIDGRQDLIVSNSTATRIIATLEHIWGSLATSDGRQVQCG